MAQTIPLYLHAHSSTRDDADPLAVERRAGGGSPTTDRRSFRPPVPPKPAGMSRTPSHDSSGAPAGVAPDTSPTLWMNAMVGEPGVQQAEDSPPHQDGLLLPVGARTPGSARESATSTPLLGQSPSMVFPPRSSSRDPPSIPPRPVNIASPVSPPAREDNADDPAPYASSYPPSLSPFAAMNASQFPSAPHEPCTSVPSITRTGSRSPDRLRSRPPQHPSMSSTASISSSASYSSLGTTSSAFSAIGRGFQQAKLKDRFGAGVGFARDWGGRGKGKLQEGWRGLQQTHRSSASSVSAIDAAAALGSSPTPSSAGLASSPSTPQLDSHLATLGASSNTGGAPAVRLPTTILGVRVPNVRGQAFGTPLAPLVERTRGPVLPGPRSEDEVTGDDARYWLPGVAFRALEYLEEWGRKEEGIYRVPGRSHMVSQLRAMFDAGVGQERDLREIHPADLDPHAVASMLKGWLRELPEPLLSRELEASIDALTTAALGYPASSSHFLSGVTSPSTRSPVTAPGSTGVVSGTPSPASSGADARAPREYLEQLRELFASAMPAENYHLLRAIAYHLARLAAHEHANKMSLNNLRLILSPTLRLSPGFLQVLVVEREILFSKANEDGRRRQPSASSRSSPALGSTSAFSTRSPSPQHPPRRSPTPGASPLLNPPSPNLAASAGLAPSASSTSNGSGSGGSWLLVDEPSHSTRPHVAMSETSSSTEEEERLASSPPATASSLDVPGPARICPQTPIADRFASSSASSAPTLRTHSSTLSLRGLAPASKPFIPTRDRANGAGAGGFFSSHHAAPSPPPPPSLPARGAEPRLSLGAEFRRALAGLDAPIAHPADQLSVSDPAAASKAARKARRESRVPPGGLALALPKGIGLGLVPGPAEEAEDGGALLSVEERRKLFGG